MKNLTLLSAIVLTATSGLFFGTMQAASALDWNWNYSGTGTAASGTFTTDNTPDSSGFYLITGITGTRNNDPITGLQPTGTAIPGNEPFNVDNLISLNPGQLTDNGFGFSTLQGNFVNPYFTALLPTPGYFEVLSGSPTISVVPISFSATPITVPEPTFTLGLLSFGTLGSGLTLKRKLKTEKSTSSTA